PRLAGAALCAGLRAAEQAKSETTDPSAMARSMGSSKRYDRTATATFRRISRLRKQRRGPLSAARLRERIRSVSTVEMWERKRLFELWTKPPSSVSVPKPRLQLREEVEMAGPQMVMYDEEFQQISTVCER